MSTSSAITSALIASAYTPQQQQGLFSQIDVNGDGQITPDELSSFGQNLPGTSGKGLKNPNLFQKIDQNGDGAISKDEWAAHRQQRHQAKSALLQVQEQSGAQKHHHGPSGARQANPGQTFSSLDTNKDGVVSAEEWAAAFGATNGSTVSSDVQQPGASPSLTGISSIDSAVNTTTSAVKNTFNSLTQTLNSLI